MHGDRDRQPYSIVAPVIPDPVIPDPELFRQMVPKADWLARDEVMTRPIADSAHTAATHAQQMALAMLPVYTRFGIEVLCDKPAPTMHIPGPDFRPLGPALILGGIVLDVVKFPFCAAIATEEAVRAGMTKLASMLFEKSADDLQTQKIFKSFLRRMRETADVLTTLRLKNPTDLDTDLRSGNIEELVGLTLLHSAFVSRSINTDGIALAESGRHADGRKREMKLTRENCPEHGLKLFEQMIILKNQLTKVFGEYRYNEREESQVVCTWIAAIIRGQSIAQADMPHATAEQLATANAIVSSMIAARDAAISIMPQSSSAVGRSCCAR